MNKLSLPLRLVRTGPDRSSVGPGFFEIATDRRPDCGCSLFRSWEFRSFPVTVQSSPGLFPVPGLDLQTLFLTIILISFHAQSWNLRLDNKTTRARTQRKILETCHENSMQKLIISKYEKMPHTFLGNQLSL